MTIMLPRVNPPPSTRFLTLGAVVGPVLFTLAWLVLGAVSDGYTLFGHRFTDYSPVSQPISGLGMGATAPYMNVAFVGTGLLLIAGVIGAFRTLPRDRPTLRRWSVGLLAAIGVGHIGCGIFTLEVSMLHALGFVLAAGMPIVAFPVAGQYLRRIPGWRRLGTGMLFGSPVTLALLVGFFATFQPTADGAEHGIAGLVQRLLVVHIHVWFMAIGWRAYRHGPGAADRVGTDPAATAIPLG